MNLKMQMRPRRAAGVADVGNDLPGFDLLACGDADARAVRVGCPARQAAQSTCTQLRRYV